MASQAVQTTLKVDVTESEQIEANRSPDSPPLASAYNIRRSLSPLLDFGRPGSSLGGERRNFCNISECAFCKPLTDNHRLLSPLRSPVISPSSRFQIHFFFCFLFSQRKFFGERNSKKIYHQLLLLLLLLVY
jgi:hypothetical protein